MNETKITMAAIGEKLKNAREKRSLKIDQVQKETRIHSSVVIALEDGRCDEILTPTYVKSFLKKYVQYLGLDTKELLKEYAFIHKDEGIESPGISSPPSRNLQYIPKIIAAAVLIIVTASLLSFTILAAKKFIGSMRRAKGPVTSPQKGKNPVLKKSAKAVKPKAPAAPQVAAPAKPAESAPMPAVAKKEPLLLVIKTKQPVLIKAKRDGVAIFNRVLQKGVSESIKAGEKIELYIAKAEAVELFLNGKSLGSLGRGTIKNLEITSKGIKR